MAVSLFRYGMIGRSIIVKRHPIVSIRSATTGNGCASSSTSERPNPNKESKSSTAKTIETYNFCLKHVEKYDRENYLAGLYINDNLLRRINIALRAFNVELSLIRDLSNNSDRAKIRFHFWSKLIDEIVLRNNQSDSTDEAKDLAYYRQTPVAKELLDLFSLVDVTKEVESLLRDLIGARVSSKVLGYQPFDSMDELELYCLKSNSAIYQLSWRLDALIRHTSENSCDNHDTSIFEQLSLDLGKAQGLSNIIRGIPYNSTKNCCYIPKDVLEQFDLSNRDFVGKNLDGAKIKPAVIFIADRCRVLLSQVYLNLSRLSSVSYYYQYRHLRNLFLPRVSIESNLKKLNRCDYNICEPSLRQRNELLALNLKLASIYYKAPVI